MAIALPQESTEYLYVGVTGDPPSVGAEIAFMAAGERPEEPDWHAALVVDSGADALWDDAQASDVDGDYFAAILVGGFGVGGVELDLGDYQVWLRLTDTVERPVRIAPIALEVV